MRKEGVSHGMLLHAFNCVLLSHGCCNKLPWTCLLIKRQFAVPHSWRCEVNAFGWSQGLDDSFEGSKIEFSPFFFFFSVSHSCQHSLLEDSASGLRACLSSVAFKAPVVFPAMCKVSHFIYSSTVSSDSLLNHTCEVLCLYLMAGVQCATHITSLFII